VTGPGGNCGSCVPVVGVAFFFVCVFVVDSMYTPLFVVCVYMYVYVCICVCMYVCMYMYVYVYVCMYVYVYVCVYGAWPGCRQRWLVSA